MSTSEHLLLFKDIKQGVSLFEMLHPIQDQLLDRHATVLTQVLRTVSLVLLQRLFSSTEGLFPEQPMIISEQHAE